MVIFTQCMKVCKVFVKHNLADLKVFHSRTTSPLFDGLLKLGRTVNYTKRIQSDQVQVHGFVVGCLWGNIHVYYRLSG